jgi:hypothetical protein
MTSEEIHLNKALEELEVHQARAMPPHERAARFRSARLPSRLTGGAEQAALAHVLMSGPHGPDEDSDSGDGT